MGLDLNQSGISSQWIEKGSMSWDCVRRPEETTWSCSGPGHYEEAKGFFLSTEPYIPGVVLSETNEPQRALKTKPSPVKGTSVFESTSATFGPLRCVRVDESTQGSSISTCFDRRGILVTQQGGSCWTAITLVRYRSTVPHSAFQLKGTSRSSGRNFSLPPVG